MIIKILAIGDIVGLETVEYLKKICGDCAKVLGLMRL